MYLAFDIFQGCANFFTQMISRPHNSFVKYVLMLPPVCRGGTRPREVSNPWASDLTNLRGAITMFMYYQQNTADN